MSQDTTVVLDGTGAEVLDRINAAIATLRSLSAGDTAPTDPVDDMLWADTANGLLKFYTGSAWITLGKLSANLGMLPLDGDSTINGNLTFSAGKKLILAGLIEQAQGADIASAATTNIASATGNFVRVTGTTTIAALGTAQAGTVRTIRFTGALTLTHNATSLILPGGQNIATAADDVAEFISLGGGNWFLSDYQWASGGANFTGAINEAAAAAITAAATTNLGGMAGNYAQINNTSGATNISALGTAPSGAVRRVVFSVTGGSVTLVQNATSLILPGGQNISVTSGDTAEFVSLGSGNWRCMVYQRNSLASRLWSIVSKTATYTVATSDYGAYFIFTATADVILNLPAASTAGVGFLFAVRNKNSNNAKITIDPNGAELIEGTTTLQLGVGSAVAFICDGTAWYRVEAGITAVTDVTYANAVEILASGNFTVPGDVAQGRVRVWGGGAGGGGGGSQGGTGGTGATGGTTSFGAIISATGGTGGTGGGGAASTGAVGTAGSSGAGGTGSLGQTNITGGAGGAGAAGNTTYGSGGGGGGGSSGGATPLALAGYAANFYQGGNGAPGSNSVPLSGVTGGGSMTGGSSAADVLGASNLDSGPGGGGGGGYNGSTVNSGFGGGGGGGGAGGYAIGAYTLSPGAVIAATIGRGGGGGGGGGAGYSGGTSTSAGSNGSGTTGGNAGNGYSNQANGGAYGVGGASSSYTAQVNPYAGAGGGANAGGGAGNFAGGASTYRGGSGGDSSSIAGTARAPATSNNVASTDGAGGSSSSGGSSQYGGGGGGGAGAIPGGGGGGGAGGSYFGGAGGGGGGGDGRIIVEY